MVTRPHPRSQCEPESLWIANCPTLEDTDPARVRERPAIGVRKHPIKRAHPAAMRYCERRRG